MTSILSDLVVVCRKAKTCDQCQRLIKVGQKYRRQVYVDGELITYRAHEDCDEAATAYQSICDYDPRYDDPIPLAELIEPESYYWLLEKFPGVAERFNIQGPVRPV